MTSRERIRKIIAGEAADRCGFWLGNPHPDTWLQLHAYFGTSDNEQLRRQLGDDFRWIPASGRLPDDRPHFPMPERISHGQAGPLATCGTLAEVEAYPWPDATKLDFSDTLAALDAAGDYYRASGLWSPFYHILMALFGMETFMINMYEKPEIVQAVMDRVCGFYLEANDRFFALAGERADGFFFGNDFGTQRDLICGTAQFDQFIMPWFRRFTELGHRHGRQVLLHSCGSIFRVIDRLIESGVDCLHPLQAKAMHMDADYLAEHFAGQIAFMGGIDTQDLLVNGQADDIHADVARVRELLGPRLIISPSHEALLPNVPPENVEAMALAPR